MEREVNWAFKLDYTKEKDRFDGFFREMIREIKNDDQNFGELIEFVVCGNVKIGDKHGTYRCQTDKICADFSLFAKNSFKILKKDFLNSKLVQHKQIAECENLKQYAIVDFSVDKIIAVYKDKSEKIRLGGKNVGYSVTKFRTRKIADPSGFAK